MECIYTFERQSHKMVKYTQTIRRQIADKLFECVWPFCEIGALTFNMFVSGPAVCH